MAQSIAQSPVVWLPDGSASSTPGPDRSDATSVRLKLVEAVTQRHGSTLDPDLLALDHAAALLEIPAGETVAASLLTDHVRGKLAELGNSVLGTGNLRDAAGFALSERLSAVALGDVARLTSFAAEQSGEGALRDLALDLLQERQLSASKFNDDFEVAIGRTITERNGGNFKGSGERLERPSVELAEELIDGAWVHYRFAISMLVAERFGERRDPFGWLKSSPLDELGEALGVLQQLDPRDPGVTDLLAHVKELIAGHVWTPQHLTVGADRPLLSEYVYVLSARGDT